MEASSIQQIDNEIRNLYEYCLKNGLKEEEILKAASPLLHSIQWEKVRKRILNLSIFVAVVAVIAGLFFYDYTFRTLCMFGRLVLIKLLPFWDWTYINRSMCLIANPHYEAPGIDETDCQVCEDLLEVDIINSASPEMIMERYLKNDIPFIVRNSTTNWPLSHDEFDISYLAQGYLEDLDITEEEICMFQTNLRINSLLTFLRNLASDNLLNKWYAHWENCGRAAEKLVRRWYHRPYFVPLAVEMREPSWFFVSSNYKGRIHKLVNLSSQTEVLWLAQVKGSNNIKLEPREPCPKSCNTLQGVLSEGEILMYTTELWKLEYLPGEETVNIALAVGGHFE